MRVFKKPKEEQKNAKIFEVLACELNYSWRIRANICVNSREHKKPLKRGRLLSLFKPQKFNLVSTLLLLRNQRIFYCSKKSAFEIRQTAECFPKFNDLLESEWHDNSNHGMILKNAVLGTQTASNEGLICSLVVHFIKSESGKSSLQMDGHGIEASILLYTLACHDSEMLLGNAYFYAGVQKGVSYLQIKLHVCIAKSCSVHF